MADIGDKLYKVLSHPDFLAMKGLANEVPIFVHTYEPQYQDVVDRMVQSLRTRLRTGGVSVAVVDLFELLLGQLESEGRLQPILDKEPTMGKKKLLDLLSNLADPKTRLIPKLMEQTAADNAQLTFLTGIGRVFPFLRTHTVLESLQPAMMRHPVVMFFPGQYTQEQGLGSQLRLFGSMANPPLYRPYYRAFNLEHYQLGNT